MRAAGTAPRRRTGRAELATAVVCLVACLTASACGVLGPPPMEPLTETALEAARRRWVANGSDAYHLVVRVRAPRTDPAVYDVVVAGGRPVAIARNGRRIPPEEAERHDFSVAGLFELLRTDLRWGDVRPIGDTPPIDLRARFAPDTGRLVRYRRTVGTGRRRVLLVEVLAYEPHAPVSERPV